MRMLLQELEHLTYIEMILLTPIKLSISKSDSLLKVNTFIDNWALKHLLIKQAKIILSEIELIKLDVMVDNYRNDLYANSYFKAVIK